MKMREQLADWISGGAITQRNAILTRRNEIIDSMDRCVNRMAEEHARKFANLANGLHAIAAQEKPTSNATVKRMARIARDALK